MHIGASPPIQDTPGSPDPACPPRLAMPGDRHGKHAPAIAIATLHPDGEAVSARSAPALEEVGEGSPPSAPKPEEARNGRSRARAERGPSLRPEAALRNLLRGLRAGDLETVLLTVAMAAEENRMPCANPDEVERILDFLARLAEHDAALPLPPGDSGVRPDGPLDAG